MYTCSSQTLVHLLSSQVLFGGSAMLSFSSAFSPPAHLHTGVFKISMLIFLFLMMMMMIFYFSFIFVKSINSFERVCVCSLSFSWWFSLRALLSLWVVDWWSRGGWRRGGASLAAPWSRLGDLMLCDRLAVQSDPLSPLYAAVVTLFEAALFSCIVAMQQARRPPPLFHFVFMLKKQKKKSFTHWFALLVGACLHGKGDTAPFKIMWLLLSSFFDCKWI